MPITIDYKAPGDYGGVTFKLSTLQDTVFAASIIWMGTGQIYYPKEFSTITPFTHTNVATSKPNDLRYIGTEGNAIIDEDLIQKADSAWNTIDSLEITNLFAEKGFKSSIYLYTPTYGHIDLNVAKWIIFLYHNDKPILTNSNYIKNTHIQIFPNPTNEKLNINLNSIKIDHTNCRIFNQAGQLVAKDDFAGRSYELDVSILNSGLFFLHLSDKNNKIMTIEKIIIE
ncbi:MAG: T9SS type A sorting domain-containing protein [bacterium]